MVPNGIENQVVALRSFREVFLGVVKDAICTDRSDHVQIPRTANAGHICVERLGDLNGERPHASCRTVNQDLVAGLNLSLVAKTLQRGECRDRYGSRLLKRHVIWFYDQFWLGGTHILGKGALAGAEYLVAWFELRYVSANRFNLAGHVNA